MGEISCFFFFLDNFLLNLKLHEMGYVLQSISATAVVGVCCFSFAISGNCTNSQLPGTLSQFRDLVLRRGGISLSPDHSYVCVYVCMCVYMCI